MTAHVLVLPRRYNPEKGSREEELGLAGACIEETTKNLNAMDFSFNFDAPAKVSVKKELYFYSSLPFHFSQPVGDHPSSRAAP